VVRRAIWVSILVGCSAPTATTPDGAQLSDARKVEVDAAIDADLTAPTDVPAVPCADSIAAVYAATPQLGAPLGSILACAHDDMLDLATASMKSGVMATSAVVEYRIAYQTRDGSGGAAVSTARVSLPSTPRARPVPLGVAAHGTVGLADACVPSNSVDTSLALPYAARGFAVIAPDLAGLGNAGMQDYLDNRAQGWQLLDGVRALRHLLAPGITAPEVVLTGYSQGGGASLSAHSLAAGDGPGIGHLVATVVYAPQWPIRLNSFKYIDMLRDPTQLTIFTGLSFSSVAVMRQFAFLEDHIAIGHGKDSVPAQFRVALANAIDTQCLISLGGFIQTQMLHTGDLIDDTLRRGLLSCIDAGACTGDAAAYYQFLLDNQLVADPHGGPVLVVQGLLDQIMPPAGEAGCIKDKLVSAGVDVDQCVFPFATHATISDNHAHGVAWAESVLGGGPRVECDQSSLLPACTQ
jgi:pimeloyl-ACP methyl ester carboxylesterase